MFVMLSCSPIHAIDEYGNIINVKRGRPLKAFPDKDGYLKVVFTQKNEDGSKLSVNRFVHRLVYEHFIGEIPEGMTVDHDDGDRQNNFKDNLKLLSSVSNVVKGNARYWEVTSPEGITYTVYNLREFCRDYGLHGGHLYQVAKRGCYYKGWGCKEITPESIEE